MATGIPARLTPGEGRKFGLVVGGAFLVLALLLWWRAHPTAAAVAGAVGTLLAAAGLVVPGRLGPVYRAWMGLALVISRFTTPVFMAILFYLVLTPAGLIARSVGHRPLAPPRTGPTYWRRRAEGARRGDLEHQF